ncbi:uncharacterized protein NPIL_503971, partial [Nephila pilipes]
NALEIVFETFIDVWNYMIFKYNMPVSSISIEHLNNEFMEEESNLQTVQEILKATDNLIDFTDNDENRGKCLALTNNQNEEAVSSTSELLTFIKELEPTTTQSFQIMTKSAIDNKNANDSHNDPESLYSSSLNQRLPFEEKTFNKDENNKNNILNGLNFQDIFEPNYSIKTPSIEEVKESKSIQIDSTDTTFLTEPHQFERNLVSIIRNNASLINSLASHEGIKSQISSSCFSGHAAISDLEQNEQDLSIEDQSIPFCSLCHHITTESENSSEGSNNGKISPNSKGSIQKKVQFREETETYLYESNQSIHHPCVVLKSPLSIKGMDGGNVDYRTTIKVKATVEDNFQSYVLREKGDKMAEMLLGKPHILKTL